MGIFNRLGGFLLHLFAFKGLDIASDVASSLFESGAKAVGERVKEEGEYRSELAGYLRSAMKNRTAARELLRRWSDREHNRARSYGAGVPYEPGSERVFVRALTDLYRFHQEKHEEKIREQTFASLGHISDERFDDFIEMVRNDSGWQWALEAMRTVDAVATATSTHAARPVTNAAWNQLNAYRVRRGLPPVAKPF